MPSIAANSLRLDFRLDQRNLSRLYTLAGVSKLEAAKALTFVAKDAQTAWREANSRVFHMRRDWINKGVRINAATPGDLNAQVGTVDKYMGRHVVGVGEDKRARTPLQTFRENGRLQVRGGLFEQLYGSLGDMKTHTAIRRTLRAAASSGRKPFVIQLSSGKLALVRRKGQARRSPLQILGVFENEVHIKPRLDALGVVADVVEHRFGPIYERLLLKALEGAKGGG